MTGTSLTTTFVEIVDLARFDFVFNPYSTVPANVEQSSSLALFKRQVKLIDYSKHLKGSATDVN